MTRQNLLSIFFIGLLLCVLYAIFLILSPFFRPMFWSATIAFGFYPIHERILLSTGKREKLAAFISTFIVFIIFLPIIIFFVVNIAREAIIVYEWLTKKIQGDGAEVLIEQLKSIPIIQKIDQSQLFQWDFFRDNMKKWLLSSASFIGSFTIKQMIPIAKNIFFATIHFFLMLFLVFFFLKDGSKIYRFIYRVTPMEESVKQNVFKKLSETFSAVLRGQIVTAIVQAVLAGVIFWLMGLPLPLFFAAVTFFGALVPVFGAAMVWFPFVIYLYLTRDHTAALTLLFFGTCVISLADNLLKPFLIGEKTKLPYLLLFLGILGGMQVFGLIGIFLAPTVLSLFFVLIKIYQEKFLSEAG